MVPPRHFLLRPRLSAGDQPQESLATYSCFDKEVAMKDRSWKDFLVVEVQGAPRRYYYVHSVRDAAHHLLDSWAGTHNAAYRDALLACTRALKGEAGDDEAFAAFVEATKASRIQIRSVSAISTRLFERELGLALSDSLREEEHEAHALAFAAH